FAGGVTLSAFTANGGLIYTNGSGVLAQTTVGSSGQCLQSNAGGAPTWGSCGEAGSVGADSLDFTELTDSLTLDASTSIAMGAFNLSTSGTGGLQFNHTGDSSF